MALSHTCSRRAYVHAHLRTTTHIISCVSTSTQARVCVSFLVSSCFVVSLLIDSLVPRLRSTTADGSPDLWCARRTPGRSASFLRRMLPGRPKSRPPSYTGRGCDGPPPSDLLRGARLPTLSDAPTRTVHRQPRINRALPTKNKIAAAALRRDAHPQHHEKCRSKQTHYETPRAQSSLCPLFFFLVRSCCRAARCTARSPF